MAVTRWGILGPGAIAHNFADGLAEAKSGVLRAIASRNPARRATFGDRYGVADDQRHDSYDAALADRDIDAVYISLPHPYHAEWAIRALRAGKAVLCEKPAGLVAGEVTAIVDVAQETGQFFMEAFMYRCHPQIARLVEILRSGEIGDVTAISSSFGFASQYDPASRLDDPALAGGAILDVGCYPVSFARLVAGVAAGADFADPVKLVGTGTLGPSGVDEEAYAQLQFASGLVAHCATSIRREMDNTALVTGRNGSVLLPTPWAPGRDAGPSTATLEVTVAGVTRVETITQPEHLFTFEAEAASAAIAAGHTSVPHPALSPADSIGNAASLDQWRAAVGYRLHAETPAGYRGLSGVLPTGLPSIPDVRIPGSDTPVSALIMGCDNQDSLAGAAVLWDAYWEAGGRSFDTAFVYGDGRHEAVLGDWIAARGLADQARVISKGAHSPYCTPRAIRSQLMTSLDRLGLERVPVYIMHRDNPDVPVEEFVTALNDLVRDGLIGVFGGSNWSPDRLDAANAFAAANGLQPMHILNNNLSLAVMEKPVWNGCVTSNTPETLARLRQGDLAHFSWSSQARGYFLPKALRDRLPEDTAPETCFGSEANAERRNRAETLAAERGVTPHNVATAWVLAQSYPSAALIGPRAASELATTLPALTLDLSEAEVAWLNLERAHR